jgi:hypothetical protein
VLKQSLLTQYHHQLSLLKDIFLFQLTQLFTSITEWVSAGIDGMHNLPNVNEKVIPWDYTKFENSESQKT